jgi:hypothetical protein
MRQLHLQHHRRCDDPPIEGGQQGKLVQEQQVIEDRGIGYNLHHGRRWSRVAMSF